MKKLWIFFLVGASFQTICGYAPNNFFEPYDPNWRLAVAPDTKFRLGVNAEFGHTHVGRNHGKNKVNVLQIYDPTQSTIAMVMMPTPSIKDILPIKLPELTSAAGAPTDDGFRGRICMKGRFELIDFTFYGTYLLPQHVVPGDLTLSAYLPVRRAKTSDVIFKDLTRKNTEADLDISAFLAGFQNFKKSLREVADLDLNEVTETGLGDLVFVLDWQGDYRQNKEYLKNVTMFAMLGLSLPTGKKKDEDRAFSTALGNDGAVGMPIGLGMELDFVHNITAGIDVEFLILFDESRVRRLKTDRRQTEFLLLNRGRSTLDHGLTWKFNLFLEGLHIVRGFSAKVAYEYVKHDDDRLTAKSDCFNHSVINSAASLEEWNMHHFIFKLNYDFFAECKNKRVVPQLGLFYKLPVTGKGIINPATFGGQLAFNF